MTKRKWHYVESPATFSLKCSKCQGQNIYWSEFENHIWCFKCEEDIYYETSHEIFPVGLARMLGITFDKIDLETGERIKFNSENYER